MEIIFNQLIFLHALRTRVNTASATLDKKKAMPKINSGKAKGQAAVPSTGSDNSQDSALISGTATPVASQASSGASKEAGDDLDALKQASIQAGSISNLIAVDASNMDPFLEITGGMHFLCR